MKVLVTGARGFIGKNLVLRLLSDECTDVHEVLEYDQDTDPSLLETYCVECDFVIHLAGVNRPKDTIEFTSGNVDLTARLLGLLSDRGGCPVLLSSSTQAALDNPYGASKKAAEDVVFAYASETGSPVFVYRLPGVFGKWSRPNYNTVVATFCHNIARDLPITINDPDAEIVLAYVDDVVEEFVRAANGEAAASSDATLSVPVSYATTLGQLAKCLHEFRAMRETLDVPHASDPLSTKLYATYLSFLPEDGFAYSLKMKVDDRGSFTEIIRTAEHGQFSVNVIKRGVIKGNHWHNTKNEKFLVVSGTGVIRFRKVGEGAVLEYRVSGQNMQVVDIPPGYTHNIENVGESDMVVFMWANECFDPESSDTYRMPV
ncbi:MAG: polysaccharide biosynthesis C-terminal domain-containing protein [Coriobacteriia bacterium]